MQIFLKERRTKLGEPEIPRWAIHASITAQGPIIRWGGGTNGFTRWGVGPTGDGCLPLIREVIVEAVERHRAGRVRDERHPGADVAGSAPRVAAPKGVRHRSWGVWAGKRLSDPPPLCPLSATGWNQVQENRNCKKSVIRINFQSSINHRSKNRFSGRNVGREPHFHSISSVLVDFGSQPKTKLKLHSSPMHTWLNFQSRFPFHPERQLDC